MCCASLLQRLQAPRAKSAFTLIELLVVIVILATLVGLGSIAVVRTLRGAEETKRSAFAKTLSSAIMAYKNEHGDYPIESSTSEAKVTFGSVSSNRAAKSNAEVFMLLMGRNSSGRRDTSKRAYLEDSSMLYVCKDKRVRKLDEALASGGISSSDMIGFPIVMNKSKNEKNLSGARAFAPIKITFDFDLDHYTVSVPNSGEFRQVIKLH